MTAIKNEELLQEEVLDNIIESITNKLSVLKISLRKLASDADVDYHTLRNILNKSTLPNLRILIKIANFLGMSPAELISQENDPQEIPIINKDEVLNFIQNKELFENRSTYKLSEFIHPYAFAISEVSSEFIIPAEIIYVCFHGSKNTSFEENQVYLVGINNQLQFIRVKNIQGNKLQYFFKNQVHIEESSSVTYVATVVSMRMSETLI
jgi:transcriptional regulator with XRE-family HTH domain